MIEILIDSASDITQAEAQSMGISMIPMEVRFGNEVYSDGVDLSHERFFEKLIESDELPKTSQINEFRWEEAFRRATEAGNEVLAIAISSKLSGTFHCAERAAKRFAGKVAVIDSLSVTTGERILAQHALHLIAQGADLKTAADSLNEAKKRIRILAIVDTLKYLRKGGRISGAAAIAGEMLSVKPVVSVTGGEVKLAGKAIGSKKSNNLLMQLVQKCGGIDFSMPYGLMYAGSDEARLKKYLQDSEVLWKEAVDDPAKIPIYPIGSTVGTHVGPNAIGVAFCAKRASS